MKNNYRAGGKLNKQNANRKKTFPKVSVIIPCFNSEKTIHRCIDSALKQTLPIYEILVFDDASTDCTPDIIRSLSGKHKKIKITKAKTNVGAGQARRTLLGKVKGEYIAFLDCDDFWYKTKIEEQIREMRKQNAQMCVCSYKVIDENGKEIGSRQPPKEIKLFNMHFANWVPTSMTVIASDLAGVGDMPMIRRRQDYAYWIGLFQKNRNLNCITVKKTLGEYRKVSGSLSSNRRKNVFANYRMFRDCLSYSAPRAGLCVMANIITRLMRV